MSYTFVCLFGIPKTWCGLKAIPDGLEFPMPYTFVYMFGIPKNTWNGLKSHPQGPFGKPNQPYIKEQFFCKHRAVGDWCYSVQQLFTIQLLIYAVYYLDILRAYSMKAIQSTQLTFKIWSFSDRKITLCRIQLTKLADKVAELRHCSFWGFDSCCS